MSGEVLPAERQGQGQRFRDSITDALAYWERRRIPYNAILAAIVMGYFIADWSHSIRRISFHGILGLFLLAVLANIAYCVAYVGDVFVQLSGLRDLWRSWRWVLWLIGTAFASIITRFFAMGFFGHSGHD